MGSFRQASQDLSEFGQFEATRVEEDPPADLAPPPEPARRPVGWLVKHPVAAGGYKVLWDQPDLATVLAYRRIGVAISELFEGVAVAPRMGLVLGSPRVTAMLVDKARLAVLLVSSIEQLKEGEAIPSHWLREVSNLAETVRELASSIEASQMLAVPD